MKRCHPMPALVLIALLGASPALAEEGATLDLTADGLSGWIVEGTKEITDGGESRPLWTIDDGVITCAGKGFGFLRYDRKVCDFVLKLEYRMSKGCNSGIGIRTVPFTGPASTRPSYASYEVQILDDGNKPPGKHSSMSLYRYVAPKASAARPAEEWNEMEIDCRGPRIRITLNGQLVQDVDQSTIDQIKNKPLCGYVCLQNHGRRIDFRNIKLTVLKEPSEANAAE